ncbi:MAG TPA: hypothetical protein PLP89_05125 [Synergistales bacterium]|nr:hypothetical protein [Synergistales bacterium]MDI9392970.1 hypothetical protein [Synergistota bacterium]NLV65904.1 hypothetical protein [Synergistaceae bacterium]MDD5515333.1 hypothetical protein [Synergistales bacterium]HOI82581.1 hypothetical protein [Synergistales bacterium]
MVFLLLEENMMVHMGRVLALVRFEGETAVLLRDGSVMATGFTPPTLARRSARFVEKGKALAQSLRQGGKIL